MEHKHKHKQKHLHELLQEDQEPFHLKNYIEHKRFQLKRPPSNSTTHLPFKTPNHDFNLCKNACFFSSSCNPTKSPLLEFPSPPKRALKDPNANSDRIFLRVSPKTSALLLELALRIQNTTSVSNSSKTKGSKRNSVGDGLFGSIFRRLSHRNQNQNRNRNRNQNRKGDELQPDSVMCGLAIGGRKSFEKDESGSCTSSNSSSRSSSEDVCFGSNVELGGGEERLCGSPFRFVLHGSPSSGHRTPEFSSPPTSRHENENKETCDGNCLKKCLIAAEEEKKEQCSPVSVLEPPFEDDVDGNDDRADDGEDDDGFDYEYSYTIVQRAQQHLLNKLYRFEKLAELDPIELEKRIQELDADDSESADGKQEDNEIEDDETLVSDEEFVSGVIRSAFVHSSKFPKHRIKLVSDLISEEESALHCNDQDALVKRVCQKLESWKKGHRCTIHMMVDKDLREEFDWWNKNLQKTDDIALEIELAIFGLLMEELSADLAG